MNPIAKEGGSFVAPRACYRAARTSCRAQITRRKIETRSGRNYIYYGVAIEERGVYVTTRLNYINLIYKCNLLGCCWWELPLRPFCWGVAMIIIRYFSAVSLVWNLKNKLLLPADVYLFGCASRYEKNCCDFFVKQTNVFFNFSTVRVHLFFFFFLFFVFIYTALFFYFFLLFDRLHFSLMGIIKNMTVLPIYRQK